MKKSLIALSLLCSYSMAALSVEQLHKVNKPEVISGVLSNFDEITRNLVEKAGFVDTKLRTKEGESIVEFKVDFKDPRISIPSFNVYFDKEGNFVKKGVFGGDVDVVYLKYYKHALDFISKNKSTLVTQQFGDSKEPIIFVANPSVAFTKYFLENINSIRKDRSVLVVLYRGYNDVNTRIISSLIEKGTDLDLVKEFKGSIKELAKTKASDEEYLKYMTYLKESNHEPIQFGLLNVFGGAKMDSINDFKSNFFILANNKKQADEFKADIDLFLKSKNTTYADLDTKLLSASDLEWIAKDNVEHVMPIITPKPYSKKALERFKNSVSIDATN